MTNVLEKEIESKLREMVEKHGGMCLKWVCPGWAGVPDRIVLLPRGRIIFVELKRPKGGKVASRQKWWRDKLRYMGFIWWHVKDVEGLENFRLVELEKPTESL